MSEQTSGAEANARSDKPRISYAEFQAALPKPLDLDTLKQDVTPLLLDGKPVIYAGHHFDTIIWLRVKNRVRQYNQADVLRHLRLA